MMKKWISLLLSVMVISACVQKKKQTQATEVPAFQPIENAVIYEVNIRQYTPEGTLNAFAAHLPRLKELGVDVLWLMPVYPISEKNRKGTLGSYYAVQDYRKVNPEYGTLEDLKRLVEQAHQMGFRVILDWVANHTGWDNPLIEQHPEWYTQKEGRIVSPVEDWADVADLNYDNAEMRDYMIGSLKYWIQEADIDGYRCDMAAMVPTDFWETARCALDSLKPVFMLAEAWEPELTEKAFDAYYGWDLYHLQNDLGQGKKSVAELPGYFAKLDTLYLPKAMQMNFIDNHDENSWAGSIPERLGKASHTAAVLAYTVPGIPLLYSGQEAGLDKRLEFFEKDEIDWEKDTNWAAFYRQLNDLKHRNKALAAGEQKGEFRILPQDNASAVFVFERKAGNNRVVVALNYTDVPQKAVLNTALPGDFENYFEGGKVSQIEIFELQPYQYQVFVAE